MSSYEHRTTNRGTRHRIRFRHHGKNQAVTFATQAQALAWKALLDALGPDKALAALNEPDAPADVRTIAGQVAHHIAHLTGISDGTRRRYTGYLDRRIAPDPLGALPLAAAGRDDFAAWVNRLAAAGLAAKTIKNHHSLLSDAMRSAVRAGLIPTNHAEGIRIETPDEDDHDEMVALTLTEVFQFVAATPHHWRPMVLFMFGTGVRWQEAAALKIGDVDLDGGTARIVRAWKDTGGHGHQLGRPKSRRSRRTIVYGRWVADALRPLMDGRGPDEFVFTNTRGGPVRYQNFSDQAWGAALHTFAGDTKVVDKQPRGRPRIRWEPGPGKRPSPHDARHTYASLQIAAGKPMKHVQDQLGHESITTTLDLYSHVKVDRRRVLVETFEPLGDGPPAQLED